MDKHTAGPWTVGSGPWSVWKGNKQIAACRWYDYDYPYEGTFPDECEAGEEAHANTLLIAAAPDLLEMLRECRDYLSCIPESSVGGDDEAVRLTRRANAAIAKATEGA